MKNYWIETLNQTKWETLPGHSKLSDYGPSILEHFIRKFYVGQSLKIFSREFPLSRSLKNGDSLKINYTLELK